MNILFLSDNFPPEVNAPASRTFEHCREWVRAGHQVTVITTAPNFPKGKLFAGHRNRLWQLEEMEGVQVLRVWTYITANAGFAKRTLDYVSFMVTGFLAGLFVRRPDVIVGTSPQFFTNCAGWMLSVFRRRPFVFELRDLWPESIKTVGAMQDSAALRLLERLELFLYRKAATVVSVTKSFKRNLISRGIDGDKIHVVTNGVDLSRFHPLAPDAALRDELGIPSDAFVAGYIGTHGMAHALETVLAAAQRLRSLRPSGNTPESCAEDGNEHCHETRHSGRKPESIATEGNVSAGTNVHELSQRSASMAPGPGFPAGPTQASAMAGNTSFSARPIRFVLLGDGARKQALKDKATAMGLDNLLFLDTVPKAEVPRYWSLLDVSIIHLRKADNFTQVIPSKLFECMGMGIPVLHGVAGESAEIVQREGVGLVFEPENAQALCDGLLRLAQDQALYRELREHCLAAAPRYDRGAQAHKMLEVLEEIMRARLRRRPSLGS